ncbi:collagen alpha-1(XII) chain-like [Saccostrea echinata]|uniref:collagen alpha-1(XII) chain-like n=1 Tax=Saccostrea echinata TaxID=191078 RepID=UPI002A81DBA6|nr:collagen alpha-1(XII) chain-like [Saccostrea echinata]
MAQLGPMGIPTDYIVLVIDTSDSVDATDLEEAIDFIYNVTKWIKIGTQDIQVAVVTYASDVKEQFDLDDYVVNSTLLNAIEQLKTTLRTGGGTYTFDALTYVKTTSFLSMRGARNNSMKAVLVMTDGQSTNYPLTVRTANDLRSDLNAEVFAIGIGRDSKRNPEIQGIASDPDSYYVYYVDSFDYLCSVVPTLVPKLDPDAGQGISTCPTEPEVTTPTIAKASSNSDVIIATVVIVAVALLAATITSAVIIERSTRTSPYLSLESQISTIVNQYGNAPLGESPSNFDSSQLSSTPDLGPREINLDIVSPTDLPARLDPLPIRNLELL